MRSLLRRADHALETLVHVQADALESGGAMFDHTSHHDPGARPVPQVHQSARETLHRALPDRSQRMWLWSEKRHRCQVPEMTLTPPQVKTF